MTLWKVWKDLLVDSGQQGVRNEYCNIQRHVDEPGCADGAVEKTWKEMDYYVQRK
jgi:hypothetical protein